MPYQDSEPLPPTPLSLQEIIINPLSEETSLVPTTEYDPQIEILRENYIYRVVQEHVSDKLNSKNQVYILENDQYLIKPVKKTALSYFDPQYHYNIEEENATVIIPASDKKFLSKMAPQVP